MKDDIDTITTVLVMISKEYIEKFSKHRMFDVASYQVMKTLCDLGWVDKSGNSLKALQVGSILTSKGIYYLVETNSEIQKVEESCKKAI